MKKLILKPSLDDYLADPIAHDKDFRQEQVKLFHEHMNMLNSAESLEDIKPLIKYLLGQELQIL